MARMLGIQFTVNAQNDTHHSRAERGERPSRAQAQQDFARSDRAPLVSGAWIAVHKGRMPGARMPGWPWPAGKTEARDSLVASTFVGPDWQRAIVVLTETVVGVVVIVTLYWAQSVFIPVALAIFLTFVLSPLVGWFRQRGLRRTPAVILVVLFAALLLGSASWVVTVQLRSVLRELPRYTQNVKSKVRSIRQATRIPSRLQQMITDINREEGATPADSLADAGPTRAASDASDLRTTAPTAVMLEPQSPAWLARLSSFVRPLMEYFGELAMAVILVVFMLLNREELRNRVIRLAGQGRIVAATKFVDEAAQRVSRFLLVQAAVNVTYGLILSLGLVLIGVDYALLWGFLGAMLRYLPYIGPLLAAVFPISLSMAMSHAWTPTLTVLCFFVALELITANLVEPRLYGHSIGVSEVALLVSAAFWAFLWGPIGLVLSSPMTVCLVVLGRHIPQFNGLAILLGDEPALDRSVRFYQRLLARDIEEAEDLLVDQLKTGASPDQMFDSVLLPALSALKRCRTRGEITDLDERFALESIREIIEDLGEAGKAASFGRPAEGASAPPAENAIPIFLCPAHDAEDQLALEMLARAMEPAQWNVQLIAPVTLAAELLEMVQAKQPDVICIAATRPGGLAHTRYICKRLRNRFPDLRILVGRFGPSGDVTDSDHDQEDGHGAPATNVRQADRPSVTAGRSPQLTDAAILLEEAGADLVTSTLAETRAQLASMLPVLRQEHRDQNGEEGASRAGTMENQSLNGPQARQGRRNPAPGRDKAAPAG
jgi:predicted PurR-regulated permease PerM